MLEKIKEHSTKAEREPVEHNALLAKCNLKLAENLAESLAEYHDD